MVIQLKNESPKSSLLYASWSSLFMGLNRVQPILRSDLKERLTKYESNSIEIKNFNDFPSLHVLPVQLVVNKFHKSQEITHKLP